MFYHKDTQTKIVEGTAFCIGDKQFPSNWLQLTSLEEKNNENIYEFMQELVDYDSIREYVVEGDIVFDSGTFIQSMEVVALPPHEVNRNIENSTKKIKQIVYSRIQGDFDEFAQKNDYKDFNEACGFLNSTIKRYVAFAQYCCLIRDKTWDAVDTFFDSVISGEVPVPKTFEDVKFLLPKLVWPA